MPDEAQLQHQHHCKPHTHTCTLLSNPNGDWWCDAADSCRYNAQAHVNRGVVLLEAGSLEEALQAFSDAAAIQPLNVQALYNLG